MLASYARSVGFHLLFAVPYIALGWQLVAVARCFMRDDECALRPLDYAYVWQVLGLFVVAATTLCFISGARGYPGVDCHLLGALAMMVMHASIAVRMRFDGVGDEHWLTYNHLHAACLYTPVVFYVRWLCSWRGSRLALRVGPPGRGIEVRHV
jgi:hypothetical protein